MASPETPGSPLNAFQDKEEPRRRKVLKGIVPFVAMAAFHGAHSEKRSAAEELDDEERVEQEIADNIDILESEDTDIFLDHPYIVYAFYYSREFLKNLLRRRSGPLYPQERIILALAEHISPHLRRAFMNALTRDCLEYSWGGETETEKRPLSAFSFGNEKEKNHGDAVDLFVPEGSLVYAMARGKVIVAESSWKLDDQFSASSWLGGNTVIIFNHDRLELQRYAHLASTHVSCRDMVGFGYEIGSVGNTGRNAQLSGHGRRLHFEINRYDADSNEMRALQAREIRERLRGIMRMDLQ